MVLGETPSSLSSRRDFGAVCVPRPVAGVCPSAHEPGPGSFTWAPGRAPGVKALVPLIGETGAGQLPSLLSPVLSVCLGSIRPGVGMAPWGQKGALLSTPMAGSLMPHPPLKAKAALFYLCIYLF